MRTTVDRNDLLKAVKTVYGVIGRNNMPILNNVLLRYADGILKVSATNLETEIKVSGFQGEGEFCDVTIPGKKLLDICSMLPDGELVLTLLNNRLTIASGKTRFTLSTLPAVDYPNFSNFPVVSSSMMLAKTLRSALKSVAFAMAKADARYFLNGMLFDLSNNTSALNSTTPGPDGQQHLRLVATDGHRMGVNELIINESLGTQQYIIPHQAILELIKVLPNSDAIVAIDFGEGFAQFDVLDNKICTKLISGKYPEYQRVIPNRPSRTALVDRFALKSALQRVDILSDAKYNGVKFLFDNGVLNLEATNSEGEVAKLDLDATYDDGEAGIAFNINYILDVLNSLECTLVAIDFEDAVSSAVFRDPDDLSKIYVVMPMRL